MKELILKALKTKYANKGFSAKTLEQMAEYLSGQVTEEAQIDNAVSGADGIMSVFQSEIDRRVNETRTQQQQQSQQQQSQQQTQSQQQAQQQQVVTQQQEDVPAWAKMLLESNKALQQELSVIKGESVLKTRTQRLSEKLANTPDVLKNKIIKDFARMKFESDEDFDTYLTETESDLKGAVQKAGEGIFPPPFPGEQNDTGGSKSAIENWAKGKVEQSKIS